MKVALISDIHANLPALEAVLADIDGHADVAATYHLGDLVGYAPWPNETVELIRARGIAAQMAGIAGAKPGDVIAFGHTHKPWHRVAAGVHLLNTGSVGKPKDGDWRAGYVLLAIGEGEARPEFIRVAYDIERTLAAIRASELPAEFAEQLRTGGVPGTGRGPA
jgi:predicted phosphodiesterase